MSRSRRLFAGGVAALLVLLVAAPALAHVTANPNTAPAGGYSAFSLRVPHGCGPSGTVEVAVQIPPQIVAVTPEQVPGWTVSTVIGELAEPYESHGELVTEGVVEVVWTADAGNVLPADQYREFGLSVRVGDVDPQTVYLPTVQVCEEGEHAWIEIPAEGQAWGALDEPAPFVEVTAGSGHGHSHDHADDADTDGDATGEHDQAAEAAPDAAPGVSTGVSQLVVWIAMAVAALALAVSTLAYATVRREAR